MGLGFLLFIFTTFNVANFWLRSEEKTKNHIRFCNHSLFLAIYILYFKTLEEGEGYFERVFNGIPRLTILFFIFWLFPLFINTYNLFRKKQVD